MKVRFGYGLGTQSQTNDQARFRELVDALERNSFDSLWLSERVGSNSPDPVVGLSVAAGRTERLRLGMSVMVLPGRNPALVAKSMASLDQLSNGRLLPAFGLGVRDGHEQQAFGVQRRTRSARFDEALPLMRRFWAEESVTHAGDFYRYDSVTVKPKPAHDLEVWMGGSGPKELDRVGRLSDGWLASFVTPELAERGWQQINQSAEAARRVMDQGHFGVLLPYGGGEIHPRLLAMLEKRSPGADPSEVVAPNLDALRSLVGRFVAVGASKFVLVPMREAQDWSEELSEVRAAVEDLET